MTEILIATVAFIVGVVAGVLFYRRHRDRIEAAAEAARKI